MLLQKIFKLIGTEISENQIPGDKRRCINLSRDGLEFIESSSVPPDLDALVPVALLVKVLLSDGAPGASGLNV
jgi:hypothetical protein